MNASDTIVSKQQLLLFSLQEPTGNSRADGNFSNSQV